MKHFANCVIFWGSLSFSHAAVTFILNFRSCVWDAADNVGGLSLHLQFGLRGQSHSPAEHHSDLRTEVMDAWGLWLASVTPPISG